MHPYRSEESDNIGGLLYASTSADNAVYTPTQLSTPIGINRYSSSTHSTPYTLDGSPYLAYPGSAPYILPMQPIPQPLPYYHQFYQGTPHDVGGVHTSIPTSAASRSQSFDRGKAMYLQHPQSPSPTPTPTSISKSRQGRYWDPSGTSLTSDKQFDAQSHLVQPRRQAESGLAARGSSSNHTGSFRPIKAAPINRYAIPPVTAVQDPGGHHRMPSASTSTSGPSSELLDMRHDTSSRQNNTTASPVLFDHGHQRSWSCDTEPRHITPGVKETPHRTLEIRRSATEGRRLVFPDKNASAGSSPGVNGSEDDLSVQGIPSQTGLPFTPQREAPKSASSLQSVPILSLTTGADGTAMIGRTNTLRANLDWMPHQVHSPTHSETTEMDSETCLMIGQLTLRTPKRSKGSARVRETDSVKRRKRLEAFGEAGANIPDQLLGSSPSPGKIKSKSPRSDRQLAMSRISGFGRLAVKKEVASRFLHIDQPEGTSSSSAIPTSFGGVSSPGKASTAITQTGFEDSTRTSVEASRLIPDWPDIHAPWAQQSKWEHDDAVIRATKLEQLRVASIERYLEEASDPEQDDSDSKLVLARLLRKRGITSRDSANACEAVLHARRNGKTMTDRDLEAEMTLPIIGPNEENGCLCGGRHDKGGAMVCCDSCSVWYHLACCGIQTEDELDDQWFCQRCQTQTTPQTIVASTAMQEDHTRFPSTPEPQHALGPAFAATNESARSYHAHSSDAALAPSPTFSPNGRFPVSLMDTPALYTSPRMTSGSSIISRNITPGTPLIQPRLRVVSYAEHYNVCQTPGASDSDYKKIYSTPKFEDFFESGLPPSCTTPALRNPNSPIGSASSASGSGAAGFSTPSTSQNFLRSLQPGSHALASDAMISTIGLASALVPSSPLMSGAKTKHPTGIADSISPSPYREHRRQISFGARVTSFGPYASHLRDHTTGEPPDGEPLRLGEELSLAVSEKDPS